MQSLSTRPKSLVVAAAAAVVVLGFGFDFIVLRCRRRRLDMTQCPRLSFSSCPDDGVLLYYSILLFCLSTTTISYIILQYEDGWPKRGML